MNVLIVNEFISFVGGAERYLIDLCNELPARGIQVDFLYGAPSQGEETAGCRREHLLPELWGMGDIFSDELRKRLQSILHDSRPDVVYLHSVTNWRAARYLSSVVPTLRYVHDVRDTCPGGKRMLHFPESPCFHPISPFCMLRAHVRRCMPRSPAKALIAYMRAKAWLSTASRLKGLLVASAFMKRTLSDNGVPPGLITVLPYFVPWRAQTRFPPENPCGLLYVGRLVPGKGLLDLIHLVSSMKDHVHLEIVGQGELLGPARRMVQEEGLGGRVTFCGILRGEGLRAAYQRNALLVVPSIFPEAFGIVGIEAAALARPAVAFDAGGIPEWLKDGETGFLVPRGDVERLREKIELLLANPELAEQMGNNGRAYLGERFLPERHVERLTAIFEEAISSFHQAGR